MTDEEAHNALLTHTRVKGERTTLAGYIIMIGYKRDGKTIVTAVEDDFGHVYVFMPFELELADFNEWKPDVPTQQ